MANQSPQNLLLALLLVASPIVGVLAFSRSSLAYPAMAVALLAIAASTFVVPPVSSDNRLTLVVATSAALPFVFLQGERIDLWALFGTYLAGASLVAVSLWIRERRFDTSVFRAVRGLLGQLTFAWSFASVRDLVGDRLGTSGWEILVPFMAGAVAWLVVEYGIWALATAEDDQVSTRYLVLAGLKDTNVFASLVATGGLFGLMYDALGWWALPVALLPYSFAHGAFKRFHETKSTYRQTIRALARIPEAAGLNLVGHADRTTDLVVRMAKDLGLSPAEVEEAEFAGLMHDIGRITLNEPTVVDQGWTDDDLARWGSEIIGGAPSLTRVADHVRHQYDIVTPADPDGMPSLVARILKVASAYDANRYGRGMTRSEALSELAEDEPLRWDPDMVAALSRVLETGRSVRT